MDNNFDWQTEEDVDWDDLPDTTPDQAEQLRRRTWPRRFWWLLLIGGLLLAGGWLALQQVAARVAEVEAEVTADLLASHELLLRAAADQDEDVVLSLLSGRDTGWTQGQLEVVTAGLWLERLSLGLTYLETPDDGITVTLSSDLFTADMVYDVVYQTDTAESITLQRTAVYRRGTDRWLYAPPDGDYWGGWEEAEFPRLTLEYPVREAEIAQRLGADLSQAVADLCREIDGFDCPADFRVRLQLDHRPQSLLAFNTAVLPFHGVAFHYQLPTLALVGLPQDEVAYDALRRGYTARLLSGVVADHTAYSCCRQAAIFRVLVDYQLSQLGITTWPVTERLHQEVASGERPLEGRILSNLWWVEDTAVLRTNDGWMAYLLVDYLLNATTGPSVVGWQTMLGVRQELYAWLETVELANRQDGYTALANQLRRYAYIQSLTKADAEPPQPLPGDDLLLACMPTRTGSPAPVQLLRYNLVADRWQSDQSYLGQPILYPDGRGPDNRGEGTILINQAGDWETGSQQISHWQAGQIRPLSPNDLAFTTFGDLSPNGRFLTAYQFTAESLHPVLFDLDDCTATGCRLYPLTGDIRWSPTGQRSLILANLDRPTIIHQFASGTTVDIWPADDRGGPVVDEPITAVRDPFWVDDDTFGYIEQEDGHERVVLVTDAQTTSGTFPLFTLDLIANRWPAGIDDTAQSILSVIPNPHRQGQFLLLLRGTKSIHLMAYHVVDQTLVPLAEPPPNRPFFLTYLMGDYLLLRFTSQQSDDFDQIFVYNMRHDAGQIYHKKTRLTWALFTPGFTVHGDWLLIMLDERHLLLALPHEGYSQVVAYEEFADCYGMTWVRTADSTTD
jgi:hypothetical protein